MTEYEESRFFVQEVQKKSLAKALNQDSAKLLNHYMSEISENHYCAGWLIGLEYKLWDVLQGGDRRFGLGSISDDDVERLKQLHESAGGWWRWEESTDLAKPWLCGEVFVTTEEWKHIWEFGQMIT